MANNAKHPQISLLLTRPQRGSDAFWKALPVDAQAKLQLLIAPLIRIEPISVDLPNIRDVIFTSANGPLCGPRGTGQIAYCVGAQTTQSAQDAGWDARHVGNTANDLVERLVQSPPIGPLTHLCGTHTRGNVAARLTAAGIKTTEITIYDQALQPLSDPANAVLGRENPIILPLFSPRTARQFAKQYKGGATLHIIALSEAVSSEVAGLNAASLHVCADPSRKMMLDAVQNVTASIPLG